MASHEVGDEVLEDLSDNTWTRREQARQRQIAIGKARPEYRRYIQEVPREVREASHPGTPDPRARISKRQFDRTLSAWRCRLHEYDVPRVAAESSRGDADITPMPRRASQSEDLDSEFSGHRSTCFHSCGDDSGVVQLRLAEGLLAATLPVGTPVTPLVGTGHMLHPSAQSRITGVGHLQLGPRQLDFGAASQQIWQPLDGTPSTMCTLSPITPAPRNRPFLQSERQQTVFEIETPVRPCPPLQQSRQTFNQEQKIVEDTKDVGRHHSPGASRSGNGGYETPPPAVTPRSKTDPGFETDGPKHSGSGSDPSSAQRYRSPPSSVAKTPLYYTGLVERTPSPYSASRESHYPLPDSACLDMSHGSAEAPAMLPQQLQYPMHHLQQQQMFSAVYHPLC